MKNIVCKLIGHNYEATAMNGYGSDSERRCQRCGKMQELRFIDELWDLFKTGPLNATEKQ